MALIAAFAICAAVTPIAAGIAKRTGLIDHPGPLKPQVRPVPYLGGTAVLVAVAVPLVVERPWYLAPLACAAAVGLADDVFDLDPWIRIGCEIGVGAVLLTAVDVSWPLAPLCVVAAVVLINAVNLLDGLDGLAAGTALMSTAGFAVVTSGDRATLSMAAAGALAGFLVWNRPPARIYLGDSGSYLIGGVLALLASSTVAKHGAVHTAAAAVLLVSVPVGEAALAIVRRVRARRPLLKGDRGHIYDQLIRRGWTPGRTTLACVATQGALAVLALAVASLDDVLAVAVTCVTVLALGWWAARTFTSPSSWIE